jgi:hypothetical protein
MFITVYLLSSQMKLINFRHSPKKVSGSWVFYFPTNPSYWTDVRYVAPWWVFPLVASGWFWVTSSVLSRQENRCFLTYLWYMSYSKDLISLLGIFVTVSRDLIAYQMTRLRWGAPQVPAKSA